MLKKLAALYALIRNEARILRFAIAHPARPGWLIPALLAVAAYLLSPIDLLPDFLPVGLVDDLVLVPLALSWIVRRLPPDIRRAADAEAGAGDNSG